MTSEQKQWMADHPSYARWKPHSLVSIKGWTDTGYLMPNGNFVVEGQTHQWARPMRMMSSGDTLYVIPDNAMKVGREYLIV